MASEGVRSKPHFQDLSTIPNTDSKWFEIGQQLGVDLDTLNSIKKRQGNDLKRKREMFRRVLQLQPNLMWKDVLLALVDVGCNDSAELTCSSFKWPLSAIERSTTEYVIDETSLMVLDSLKPPDSGETIGVSVRSTSESAPPESDSDEFHSAPSASDDFGFIGSSWKSSTTNFGASSPFGNVPSPKARTEVQTGLTPSYKGFQGGHHDVQPSPTGSLLGFSSSGESHLHISYDLREELLVAVTKGDLDTVMKIIGNNPKEVDAILNEKRQTALMIASIEGHKEIVSYLLDKKASVSHKDIEGATVVFATSSVGNYEVLKLLLANPRAVAEINTKDRFENPILLNPASKGFSMVSEYLLENRANPNDTTRDGVTPLYRACEKGQKEVAKVLLEHGADIVKPCLKTSKTPLQEVVDSGHNELIPVLVKALKRVNEKNTQLFTVTTIEALRALVNKGADVDSRGRNGVTPLMVHSEKKEKELVQELIKLRANVDLQNNDGYSALMIAAKQGDSVVVQILIGASAILDFKERERGHTALILATIGLHTRVVKELVLAKADINIRSRDGRTALDMAKELNYKEIVELLTPTQSQTTTDKDPFISLLTSYLSGEHRSQRTDNVVLGSAGASRRPMAPKPVSQDSDETSSLREELKKSYRRIADLETRVNDLTLQTSMDFPTDSDLSYMEKSRLETEFRKVKELKKKAEHYAIEAKQTAQRLSAENFKLKEDLSKERHHNELTRKNMLREMEQKVDKRAASADLLNAKKEVFEREISIRAHQLLRSMPRDQMQPTDDAFELSPEEVMKIMLKARVRVSIVLLTVTGLPCSGKTTLVRNILGGSENSYSRNERYQIPGFRMHEAIIRKDLVDSSMDIFPSVKQQAETHAIATVLVRQLTRQKRGIKVTTNFANFPPLFEDDKEMHEYCKTTCQCLSDLILELERTDRLGTLVKSALTFVNIFDVGMNKSVFEILPQLNRHCQRVVQINALNLALYGRIDVLCNPPALGRVTPLKEKYSQRDDDQLMALCTTRDYFLQAVSCCHGYSKQVPSTLMVATHTDQLHKDKNEVKEKKRTVLRLIRRRAEELGLASVHCEDFIGVNATAEDDYNKVKTALLELIDSQKQHLEVDMPLNALFLRCFLNKKKLMFISRDNLLMYAKKVGIDDLEEFLIIFLSCGSLFCSLDKNIPFLYKYVILDPPAFVQEMDILYYLQFHARSHPADLDAEVRNTKVGIVTDRLAKKIWTGKSGDQLSTYEFCLKALVSLQFIMPIKRSLLHDELFPDLPEHGDCYFMPTVRTQFTNLQKINHESMYITYETDIVPFHKLGMFVDYFQTRYEHSVRFKPCISYNVVEFEWIQSDTIPVALISIIFQSGSEAVSLSGVVEVKVEMEKAYKEYDLKQYIYSVVKTACVHVFHQTTKEIPALKYKLAVTCPLQSINPSKKQKSHLLNFPIETTDGFGIYCPECAQTVGEQESTRLLWVKVKHHGPKSYGIYEEELLTDEELKKISIRLAEVTLRSKLVKLATELGQTEEDFYEDSPSVPLQERFFILLQRWRKSCAHCSKKALSVILDNCGLFVEACRLDPECLLTQTMFSVHISSTDE